MKGIDDRCGIDEYFCMNEVISICIKHPLNRLLNVLNINFEILS